MKAILMVDVPMLDDGRHLCNECPIWNKEYLFCEYDFNMEAKGCPLMPLPMKRHTQVNWSAYEGKSLTSWEETDFDKGWNACVDYLEGDMQDD